MSKSRLSWNLYKKKIQFFLKIFLYTPVICSSGTSRSWGASSYPWIVVIHILLDLLDFSCSASPCCNKFLVLTTCSAICLCFLQSMLSLQPSPFIEQVVSYLFLLCHSWLYSLYCIFSQLYLFSFFFFLNAFCTWNEVCIFVLKNKVIWLHKQPIESFVANITVKEVSYFKCLVLSRNKTKNQLPP